MVTEHWGKSPNSRYSFADFNPCLFIDNKPSIMYHLNIPFFTLNRMYRWKLALIVVQGNWSSAHGIETHFLSWFVCIQSRKLSRESSVRFEIFRPRTLINLDKHLSNSDKLFFPAVTRLARIALIGHGNLIWSRLTLMLKAVLAEKSCRHNYLRGWWLLHVIWGQIRLD